MASRNWGTTTQYFLSFMKQVLDETKCQPSSLLRTVAPLPFQLIVTTNYDSLMEQALDEMNRPFLSVVQPIEGFSPVQQNQLLALLSETKDLVLYKLHRSFVLRPGPEPSQLPLPRISSPRKTISGS